VSGAPDPKSRSLARGERRYRRKVASPKQWQAIIEAKRGPCRVCALPETFVFRGPLEYHHLLARARGGDDVEDNIVPLHGICHGAVTAGLPAALRYVAESLTDAEYAYIVGKLGEGGMERLFGVAR
jgi:5-methylcytosine-specific restriction endonuclease McrA